MSAILSQPQCVNLAMHQSISLAPAHPDDTWTNHHGRSTGCCFLKLGASTAEETRKYQGLTTFAWDSQISGAHHNCWGLANIWGSLQLLRRLANIWGSLQLLETRKYLGLTTNAEETRKYLGLTTTVEDSQISGAHYNFWGDSQISGAHYNCLRLANT